jgi:archaellum component FlaC
MKKRDKERLTMLENAIKSVKAWIPEGHTFYEDRVRLIKHIEKKIKRIKDRYKDE